MKFEEEIAALEDKIAALTNKGKSATQAQQDELKSLKRKLKAATKKVYSKLTPWDTVQIARHPQRPLLRDFIKGMCSEFLELHGDRNVGDDKALIGGFATIDGQRCMLIGMVKGRTVEEKVESNFGMPNPEGYRKALRLMKLAEKYHLPIVCIIDTPAA